MLTCLVRFLLLIVALAPIYSFSSQAIAEKSSPARRPTASGKPWLGIAIERGDKGVLIKGVLPNTPAEKSGFRTGDQVIKINGSTVAEPQELISLVQSFGIGEKVAVSLLRDGKTLTRTLKLVMKPDELQLLRDRFVGKSALDFIGDVVVGKEPSDSKKLRGRVTIVEFWATWCSACVSTHPKLSSFAEAHPEIAVIAISDEERSVLAAYADRVKPKFTILRAADPKILSEWMASAIPMIVVIGKDNKVEFVTVGAGEAADEALSLAAKLAK